MYKGKPCVSVLKYQDRDGDKYEEYGAYSSSNATLIGSGKRRLIG